MTSIQPMPSSNSAPPPLSPRFTLELEFVLSLSNPDYLTWLGVSYPHLLNAPTSAPKNNNNSTVTSNSNDNSDAAKFARYLAYLYNYWKTPQYSHFLTHPAATLRNLELLQHERFRRDMISLDVRERLREGFVGFDMYNTAEMEGPAEEAAAAAAAAAANDQIAAADSETRLQHAEGENGVGGGVNGVDP